MQNGEIVSVDKYPTDAKLLLCQLVYDAKDDNSWQDICDRYISHPIITRLHGADDSEVTDIKPETLSSLIIAIINDTISKPGIVDNQDTASKRPRGRRSHKNDQNVRPIEQSSVELEYFQQSNEGGRELLASCCNKLQETRVAEIKRKLSSNRKEFGQLLSQLT